MDVDREALEWALAIHFSQNRQPDMSGDPRNRLSPLQRRNMNDAIDALLPLIEAHTRAAVEAERAAERVFTLGAGKCVTNWGTYVDKPCVFLEPLPDGQPGEHGAKVPDHLQGERDRLRSGSVVLVLEGRPTAFLEDIATAIAARKGGPK